MKKHKRTKATEISAKVKKIVWERDNCCCIFCHRYVPMFFANAHYIKRSQGGLGIPENIFTACKECHDKEEFGKYEQLEFRDRVEEYLRNYYGDEWTKEKIIYKKG